MHSGFNHFCVVMFCLMATPSITLSATPQPQVLYATQANCKLIRGYSRNDLAGVALESGVPIEKVSFIKAEWGKGPEGKPQCNMVFNTPEGKRFCTVFAILKTDFVFGQAVTVKGQPAICRAQPKIPEP